MRRDQPADATSPVGGFNLELDRHTVDCKRKSGGKPSWLPSCPWWLFESLGRTHLTFDVDDFSANRTVLDYQLPHAHRQLEAPRPRAARIEIKHAMLHALRRLMAVPVDHHSESGRLRLQVEFRKNVQQVNRHALDFDNLGQRNLSRPDLAVNIPTNSS